MAKDKLGVILSAAEYFKYTPPPAPKLRDMTPDRKGEDDKVQPYSLDKPTFSLDKPTFRSDVPLKYGKGGSVRGCGCATKGVKKCKIR